MTAKKRTYKTKTRKVRELSGIVSEVPKDETPMIKVLAQEYVDAEFSREMELSEHRDGLASLAAAGYIVAFIGVAWLTSVTNLIVGGYALLVVLGSIWFIYNLADTKVNW